ncbi:MAG: hypothetical protein HY690_18465 [Chloroflexi bacterium]|nr:hypothetical protein [Chloroflexota bacterium]
MVTKSIRLTDVEAAELHDFVVRTGQAEAAVLRRAALGGLRAERLEAGIAAYLRGADTQAAADLAGMPRAQFLHELMACGVTVLRGPSTVLEEAAYLEELLGDERLRVAVEAVAAEDAREAGPLG